MWRIRSSEESKNDQGGGGRSIERAGLSGRPSFIGGWNEAESGHGRDGRDAARGAVASERDVDAARGGGLFWGVVGVHGAV